MGVSAMGGIVIFVSVLGIRGVSNLKVGLLVANVGVVMFVARVSVLLHNVLVTNYVLPVSEWV